MAFLADDPLATGGGGGISPTFGAALWIVDYVMQSLILGIKVRSMPLWKATNRTITDIGRLYTSIKAQLEIVCQLIRHHTNKIP